MTAKAMSIGLALLAAGCALQGYQPQPLDPASSQAALIAIDSADPALRDALARHGIEVSQWPLPQWNLAALTALAHETRADLALARAERASTDAARQSAQATRNPGFDFTTEHHSARAANGSPWTFGLTLELPLTGASRRTAQLAQADAGSRKAQWQLALRVWQVRSEVRDAYVRWHAGQLAAAVLDSELALRRRETALLDKRLAVGAVGGIEPARARQREADTARQHATAVRAVQRARDELAQAVGLAPETLGGMMLAALPAEFPPIQRSGLLQRTALHDRLDVRAALERYAASEAALQLEIARQIPELSIKPGYAWDQGDNRWSLGLSALLPLLDRNAGPIAEARAHREAQAARFLALQARAIAELHAAHQLAAAARADLEAARALAAQEAAIAARVERRLASGDADRLDQVGALIAAAVAQRHVAEAQAAQWQALASLEDAVQRPLDAIAAGAADPLPAASSGIAAGLADSR
jgi:outer membrane protein TolC